MALQKATKAATTKPMSSPDPAAPAAGVNAAKTPAPIMDPSPISDASNVPSRRAKARELLTMIQPIPGQRGGSELPTSMKRLLRDVAPDFRKALEMWFSTVLALMPSCSPISTLVR